MSVLICPVCGEQLNKSEDSLKCKNNHCFDFAKEGYVNLLTTSKKGELIGDNKSMANSRKDFLEKGYFEVLKNELFKHIKGKTVLDICCGEGYYDDFKNDFNFFAFDISKNMVRLAAKKNKNVKYFVGNISNIPVDTGSVDTAFHLFAPFNDLEFARVLKSDGTLISVIPGACHLWGLKKALYETPYKNDEKAPMCEKLELVDRIKVTDTITLNSKEDVENMFKMTPYYYHTSEKDKEKLPTTLTTDIEFVLLIYKKK